MVLRNKESYIKFIYEFATEIFIVCPTCNKQAFLQFPANSFANNIEMEIKLICTHCGFIKTGKDDSGRILFSSVATPAFGNYKSLISALNPIFRIPLWLSIDCCNNTLWAYNYEHLTFLKSHVETKLRGRNGAEGRNKSLGSRLPRWMTSAKNRESVLQAIQQLQYKSSC